ncbi:YtxH domain-containing protein [Flavobacterium sp. FZUC8N2.13]|uniref:YtxH domain-containing protein n=1 Tax=Flavobacterium zubiriense TaxID=3138075 RepID=A0ABV4TB85_9FLAO
MKTAKTIIGVLGGVAVGAALGILFAPDKGTNTRKKIAEKGNDTKNSLKNCVSDLLENFSEKCDAMLNKAEGLVNEGVSKTEEFVAESKEDLNSAKNQIYK